MHKQPHACAKCGKAFSQGSKFMLHQRAHTWVCPYVCPENNKAFHNDAYLIQHHNLHTR